MPKLEILNNIPVDQAEEATVSASIKSPCSTQLSRPVECQESVESHHITRQTLNSAEKEQLKIEKDAVRLKDLQKEGDDADSMTLNETTNQSNVSPALNDLKSAAGKSLTPNPFQPV